MFGVYVLLHAHLTFLPAFPTCTSYLHYLLAFPTYLSYLHSTPAFPTCMSVPLRPTCPTSICDTQIRPEFATCCLRKYYLHSCHCHAFSTCISYISVHLPLRSMRVQYLPMTSDGPTRVNKTTLKLDGASTNTDLRASNTKTLQCFPMTSDGPPRTKICTR